MIERIPGGGIVDGASECGCAVKTGQGLEPTVGGCRHDAVVSLSDNCPIARNPSVQSLLKSLHSAGGTRHVTGQNQGVGGQAVLNAGAACVPAGRRPVRMLQPGKARRYRGSRTCEGRVLTARQYARGKPLRFWTHHHDPAGPAGSRDRPV